MSPPSIFTPRAMNSAPSRAFSADSAAVLEMRSPNTSGDKVPIPSSAMPRRDLRSGMSVASSVRSSSLMSSLAPRSTVDTNFRSDASIAPNSSTSSSTSSLRSVASSDVTSAASSSSCIMIRSISTCNARTAATRARGSHQLLRLANRLRQSDATERIFPLPHNLIARGGRLRQRLIPVLHLEGEAQQHARRALLRVRRRFGNAVERGFPWSTRRPRLR